MPSKKIAKLVVDIPEVKSNSTGYDSIPSPATPSPYGQLEAGGRRTSRACDQCRKTKTKCDHNGNNNVPCRSCLFAGYEPTQKRGPPKGYLSALESRLHESEALLGVILSTADIRAQTLVTDLRNDPLASTIIKRITNSVFGPVGRAALRGSHNTGRSSPPDCNEPTNSRRQQMNCREVALMPGGDAKKSIFTTPSNAWQDYLCDRLAIENSHACEMHYPPRPASTGSSPSVSNDVSCYLTPQGSAEILCLSQDLNRSPRPKMEYMMEQNSLPARQYNWSMGSSAEADQHAMESTIFTSPLTQEYFAASSSSTAGVSIPCGWNISSSSSNMISLPVQHPHIRPFLSQDTGSWEDSISNEISSLFPMD
ncbi:hypothetical protein M422DRAFT_64258 [Sphaerobolus stellatus SS14]|nr:hypothetical protein M422DRAFT_64258 [Sphaerobolus stellatus SS14]